MGTLEQERRDLYEIAKQLGQICPALRCACEQQPILHTSHAVVGTADISASQAGQPGLKVLSLQTLNCSFAAQLLLVFYEQAGNAADSASGALLRYASHFCLPNHVLEEKTS